MLGEPRFRTEGTVLPTHGRLLEFHGRVLDVLAHHRRASPVGPGHGRHDEVRARVKGEIQPGEGVRLGPVLMGWIPLVIHRVMGVTQRQTIVSGIK